MDTTTFFQLDCPGFCRAWVTWLEVMYVMLCVSEHPSNTSICCNAMPRNSDADVTRQYNAFLIELLFCNQIDWFVSDCSSVLSHLYENARLVCNMHLRVPRRAWPARQDHDSVLPHPSHCTQTHAWWNGRVDATQLAVCTFDALVSYRSPNSAGSCFKPSFDS